METNSVIKNREAELPIPSKWRSTIAKIVDALVAEDYVLRSVVPNSELRSSDVASQMRSYIEDYGEKLIPLSEKCWDSSVYIWQGKDWLALVDLSTDKEEVSDLVMQLSISELEADFKFTVEMVYVP